MTTDKNKAAVSLGRLGGKAKNAKLTKEQRNIMMAQVRSKLKRNHNARMDNITRI